MGHGTGKGVAASLGASGMFGLVFYLSGSMTNVAVSEIFVFRVLAILACYLLLMVSPRARKATKKQFGELLSRPGKFVALFVAGVFIGVQLWVFSWAPRSGHALDAAMGFLLMPIVLVLAGRYLFKDAVRPLQWVAVMLAGLAVASSVVLGGEVSWLSFVICIGYPAYFVLRRKSELNGPIMFGFELLVLSPAVLYMVLGPDFQLDVDAGLGLLVAAGLAGAVAMGLYLRSARLLQLPLFGLLGYVEPVLLFVVASILGEFPQVSDLATYLLLFLALSLIAIDSYWLARNSPVPRS
jgi:chloramphenicol-sensitive protein RarD